MHQYYMTEPKILCTGKSGLSGPFTSIFRFGVEPAVVTRKPELLVYTLIRLFRLYPDVFPKGYFRFLKVNLQQIIDRGTYIYRDGVFLGWKVYKRGELKGSVLIEKLVSATPGKGFGRAVMSQFLSAIDKGTPVYVKVACLNKTAINFYQSFGFQVTSECSWGNVKGQIMCRVT
jgi:ribosomal protein S18 acetylase RimI-like enzyme